MPSPKNSRRNRKTITEHDANGIKLAEVMLQRASTYRKRIDVSCRVHPELADPELLAFWLDAFRKVAGDMATELEEHAQKILKECGGG